MVLVLYAHPERLDEQIPLAIISVPPSADPWVIAKGDTYTEHGPEAVWCLHQDLGDELGELVESRQVTAL